LGNSSGRYHATAESCQEAGPRPPGAGAVDHSFQKLLQYEQCQHLAYIKECHRMREVGPADPMAFHGSWLSRSVRRRRSNLKYPMVDRKAVLEAIAEFFAENFPKVPRDNIEGMKASDVIQQSLDLVEFVLHLEEKLGLEININTLGEKLITKTFGELADDLVAIGKGA
jgi:acyl carrier protein